MILLTKEIILDFVKENMSAEYCFVLFDLLAEPEQCQYWGEVLDGHKVEFMFDYKNNLFINGRAAFKYVEDAKKAIKTRNNKVKISFYPKLSPLIKTYFHDFSISDQAGLGVFNHFSTMHCKREAVTPTIATVSNIERVNRSDLVKSTPGYIKEFVKQGELVFGKKLDEQFVSYVPVPHIHENNDSSLAIIRGVWTEPKYRNKGYCTETMQFTCKTLFKYYKLKDIYLWVESRNAAAMKVYKKIGFMVEGKIWGSACRFKNQAL